MKYLLDTNACVDYLSGRYPSVIARLQRSGPSDLGLSTVVAAELRYGADRSARPKENHDRIDALVAEIPPVEFDLESAEAYGRLRTRLEAKGTPIGPGGG